jgi:hypothetical protein
MRLYDCEDVLFAIISVPNFPQAGLARITNNHLCDVRLEKIVQPGSPGSFFQGHVQIAAQGHGGTGESTPPSFRGWSTKAPFYNIYQALTQPVKTFSESSSCDWYI